MEKKKLGIKVESSENVGTKMWFSPMLNDINLLTICNLKIKSYYYLLIWLPITLLSYFVVCVCVYIYI